MQQSKLQGNIADHMRLLADLENEQRKYFHFDSQLWRAVQKQISKNNVLIQHPKDHCIRVYRGTGHGIRLNEVHLYAKDYKVDPPKEADVFGAEISIDYIHEENTFMDDPPTVVKRYTLNLPITLEVEFNQQKFDRWFRSKKDEQSESREQKDLRALRRLCKKYPNYFIVDFREKAVNKKTFEH